MIAVAVLSLVVAGCGGGGSPGIASVSSSTASGITGSPTSAGRGTAALRVAGQCIRQHGIPGFPDPTVATSGLAKGERVLDKEILRTIPQSVVTRTLGECRTELERADVRTSGPHSAANTQDVQYLLAFARCVRRHGVPNFPDPSNQGSFNLAGTGINSHQLSLTELAAARTCLPAARGAVDIPAQGTTVSNSGGWKLRIESTFTAIQAFDREFSRGDSHSIRACAIGHPS
jgi:hypothetical protein